MRSEPDYVILHPCIILEALLKEGGYFRTVQWPQLSLDNLQVPSGVARKTTLPMHIAMSHCPTVVPLKQCRFCEQRKPPTEKQAHLIGKHVHCHVAPQVHS